MRRASNQVEWLRGWREQKRTHQNKLSEWFQSRLLCKYYVLYTFSTISTISTFVVIFFSFHIASNEQQQTTLENVCNSTRAWVCA